MNSSNKKWKPKIKFSPRAGSPSWKYLQDKEKWNAEHAKKRHEPYRPSGSIHKLLDGFLVFVVILVLLFFLIMKNGGKWQRVRGYDRQDGIHVNAYDRK